MANEIEIWKDIAGYEGLYQASDRGRIKSLERIVFKKMNGGNIFTYKRKGRLLHQYLSKSGYYFVRLSQDGALIGYYVHGLVANAFIQNYNSTLVVNHKDGNKLNNNTRNLEWVTRSANQLHAYATGLQKSVRGDNHHLAKLKYDDIIIVRELAANGVQQKSLAERFKVSRPTINKIVKNKERLNA